MFYINLLIFSIICHNVSALNVVNKSQNVANVDCVNVEFPINTDSNSNKFIVELLLEHNYLKIIPKIKHPSETFLRITNKQTTHTICSKSINQHLFELTEYDLGEEYSIEFQFKHDTRFILLKIPKTIDSLNLKQQEIFCYIDRTDQNVIELYIQPLAAFYNVANYKIEIWREKFNMTTLQDLRLIPINSNKTISFHYFTYYEEGSYFFTISAINNDCPEDFCVKTTTPHVYIERKSMSLVIGIVGASFILPFVLFVFHILTKKYSSLQQQTTLLDANRKILIVYQQSTQSHNNVVITFGKYLEELFNIEILYDIILKSKCLKQSEKLCDDTLTLTNDIIYITPPIYEDIQQIDFLLNNKRIVNIIFEYATKKLPVIIENSNSYQLLDQLEEFFINFNLNYDRSYNKRTVFYELIEQIQLANSETRQILNSDLVPMIIVTDTRGHFDDFKD